jgi:NitT/TauT family transport system substrate-binding protein
MTNNINHIFLTLVYIIFGVFLTSCSSEILKKTDEHVIIKIAVLPILDTLPMYVAQEEGIFDKHGIKLEFIHVSSAPKRDEMVHSGRVDGMINEIVSTVFYNREVTNIQIVRYARTATSDSAIFRILISEQSGINTLGQLKGIEIGVSKGTVIEYLTDRLLQAEGFSPGEIKVIAVPDIGQRMALLGSGELEAAMLPDPLATLVMQQGAKPILEDSSHPEYSHSVYSFRTEFINQYPDALRGFLAAIEEAVMLINADPDLYRDLLTEKELVPPPLGGSFDVPKFVSADVPTQTQWDDVVTWINEKGLEVGKATYTNSVIKDFLP